MERLDMRFVKIIHAPGLVEGSSEVQDDAPFALYQIADKRQDQLHSLCVRTPPENSMSAMHHAHPAGLQS